jgi:tRNA(adenine34) deaminase
VLLRIMKKSYEFYMGKALDQARIAFAQDEVPIGAVIINEQGDIIARASNKVETCHSQTEHAELRAIAKAGKKLGDWRLEKCWMYITLEPCAMCMNAIIISRLAGIVYGASSPLFGYQKVDKEGVSWLYKKDTLAIIGGVYSEQSAELLKNFFKPKREKQ